MQKENIFTSSVLPCSGESGAGKTESTKLVVKQIIDICNGNTQLEQQILQVRISKQSIFPLSEDSIAQNHSSDLLGSSLCLQDK